MSTKTGCVCVILMNNFVGFYFQILYFSVLLDFYRMFIRTNNSYMHNLTAHTFQFQKQRHTKQTHTLYTPYIHMDNKQKTSEEKNMNKLRKS